jgi:hypothetical protein
MAASASVKYIDLGLNSVSDYWNTVLLPPVSSYVGVATPLAGFQSAAAVWHLNEWVWHENAPGQTIKCSDYFDFREDLLARCPELGLLRDVADATKHRGLDRATTTVKSGEPQRIMCFQ